MYSLKSLRTTILHYPVPVVHPPAWQSFSSRAVDQEQKDEQQQQQQEEEKHFFAPPTTTTTAEKGKVLAGRKTAKHKESGNLCLLGCFVLLAPM